MNREDILKTEFNYDFIHKMENSMENSFHKYGPMKENYAIAKTIDCIKSMLLRIEKYQETGELEFMVDVANQAMIEFTHPQHPKAHYRAKENAICKMAGFGVNEIKNFENREL